MARTLFNDAADSPALLPLPIDVVSVQSQVVYGRVGNNINRLPPKKSAQFTMQPK